MNPFYKNLALWLVISLMMVMLFQIFKQPDRAKAGISYSDFLTMVESGSVNQVTIQGENISGMSTQGPFKTYAPKDPELISILFQVICRTVRRATPVLSAHSCLRSVVFLLHGCVCNPHHKPRRPGGRDSALSPISPPQSYQNN